MNKFEVRSYEPKYIYGEDLTDAIMRQRVFRTEKGTRRVDTAPGFPEYFEGRYIFESYGGEERKVKNVIETFIPENITTLDGKQFWRAICELENGKIIQIDAILVEERGRPTIYDKKMRQTAIWLPEEQLEWLRQQGNISETIRALIAKAMSE